MAKSLKQLNSPDGVNRYKARAVTLNERESAIVYREGVPVRRRHQRRIRNVAFGPDTSAKLSGAPAFARRELLVAGKFSVVLMTEKLYHLAETLMSTRVGALP